MLGVIDAALDRTRTVLMLFILLIISGSVTYSNIPKESNPDITIPIIYVSIVHDGISPEDAERMLIRPMENELRSLEGVKEMTSNASEGHASVQLEFIAGFDSKEALADVRDKVTIAKAKLPSETEEPVIKQVSMADEQPVITVVLSGPVPERGLVTIARELKDVIEGLKEVLEVEVGGDREDIVEIVVDPLLMESYGLDQGDIFNLLDRNNRLVAAGTLDNGAGRFAVKVPSVYESVKDVYDQPIKIDGDKVITFGDVAQVRRSYKDPNSFARLNAHPAVSLEIKKRPGENIIETIEKVKDIVEQGKGLWPEHIEVTYTGDQSKDVRQMLKDLQNNVLSAVILVVIVIIATLGSRSAILVGISIPGSFLTGILVISLMGMTVNMVVLFSLIMAVGMLVDGAIVVTEFADRMMSEGKPRKEAYRVASRRMAWPIIASTATTLAAFAPLIFWPGMMGEFMKYLPITLIAVLTASLFMALIFVPAIGSLIGKVRPLSDKKKRQLIQAEEGDITKLGGFTGRYVGVLAKAIAHPFKTLLLSNAISIAVFMGYGASGLGVEFFPNVEPVGANITVRSHGDLSIHEKDKIMQKIEQRLVGLEEIETLYARTGGSDQVGYMRMNLVDWQVRRKADKIIADVYSLTEDIAGVEIEVRKDENGPSGGKALVLELSSRFPGELSDAVRTIRKALDETEKFINISDTANKDGIEWQLLIDRSNAARFGADATLVGSSISMITNGLKIGEYRPDDVDDELDIRVRYPEEKRDIGQLQSVRVKTASGLVPVSNFVEQKAVPKVDVIRRVDGRRVVQIAADMAPGVLLSQELPMLMEQLPSLNLSKTINIQVRGENEDQAESEGFLQNAFLVALFVMAIILVTQFNSFYQALLILSAVIFSTVGVFLGLMIVQKPFGIVMSGIGVISLAGIVVNNNIVLIDTYNVLRKEGMRVAEAILRTGAQRLRPVMLTTVTTILGLMPMVLEVNIDLMDRLMEFGGPSTQWWSQLSLAVAGGLAFSTLLTLVLTPCLLMMGENIKLWYRGVRKVRTTEIITPTPST
ncbi:efflux RND transporter permease subunit [Psychrosphaera sp. B3R10]|uniref:efflux RND transporter permease subunit n=1 Tax=unclassified Psychrosphaera TaxID=2641570 RepID=UPI001C08CA33|nr:MULTISPECIES: efflux RND transporter permease subunit [unclassified Psychrosphaera]MBU2882563.1 efflux RND transporter permease subunit [Psychrosphaera sp. I2R16]MBU2989418.1 efflux RND transporter permease subunit [Psychrosphaera sp. B3R10]